MLYRDDYYRRNEPGYVSTHVLEVNTAKMRDGIRDNVIKLTTDLRYQNSPTRATVGESFQNSNRPH